MVTLLCTVRNCRQPLERDGQRIVCTNGHSFDVARSGYINLLQPQDRRSSEPGDSREAVAARRRWLEAGHEPVVIEAVRGMSPALDVGCGEGSHLSALNPEEGHGVDLSAHAIDLAARRYPAHHWIVANADRFLPYADRSFALVTSITSRLNPDEFRRVVRDDGQLLVALTAPDDLRELRTILHGQATERDRVQRTIDMFVPLFADVKHERVTSRVTLTRADIDNVLASSYRGARKREHDKLEGLDTLDVTLSRDILLFRPS
jgi:23S rRNA (guanine745-N1)-methyltransferase